MRDTNHAGTRLRPVEVLHITFAAIVLIFAPTVGLMLLDSALPIHQHVAFLGRALWSVPVTLAYALVLWPPTWLVCRSPNSRMLMVMFALIYTPVNAYQLTSYANVACDHAPAKRVVVRFVRREVHSKGRNYDTFTSWDDPNDTVELTAELPSRNAVPGALVSLLVHPGRLGLEWVSDLRAE
jgi:hypothetical protein